MEEKTDRRVVGPVQVVDHDEQRRVLGERAQHVGVLLEDPVLIDTGCAALVVIRSVDEARPFGDLFADDCGEADAGEDRPDQVRPHFAEDLSRPLHDPAEAGAVGGPGHHPVRR